MISQNVTQNRILKTILSTYDNSHMTIDDYGKMLQEIGVFLLWNSPVNKNQEREWKKIVNAYIKPFIQEKKIKGEIK